MHGDTQSFIVRLWNETIDTTGNAVVWRGSIDHVGSGKRAYFHNLEGAFGFIQEQIGLRDRRNSWWRSALAWVRHESDRDAQRSDQE